MPSVRSTWITVFGLRSTISISVRTSSGAAVTHGRPIIAELPKKMSENDSPTIAWMPQRCSACGACSRDEPQPKLRLTSSTDAPWKCGSSNGCDAVRALGGRGPGALVLEHVLLEPVEGDRPQEPRRDDAIGVDVVAAHRQPAALDARDFL